jgi:ClpP class serine protease
MVALAVSINSEGGQPVQSQIIANKLVSFANSNNVKLYTFANDKVAGAAYRILSAGHHVYADRSSLIGNISLAFMKYHFQGML